MHLAFLLIGLLVFGLYGWLRYKTMLNPLTVFNGVWLVAIVAYQLRLSLLQMPLSEQGILLLAIALMSFNAGYTYLNVLTLTFRRVRHRRTEESITTISVARKPLLFVFYAWLLLEIAETIYSGGLPLFWSIAGTGKSYFDYGIASIHGLANSLLLVLLLLSYTYLLKVNSRDWHVRMIFGFLLGFPVLMLTRQVIVSGLVEVAVLRILLGGPIKRRVVLVGLGAFVIGFGLLGSIRTGTENFYNVAVIKSPLPSYLSGFHWFYMYLTMTIANVDVMAGLGSPMLMGTASFGAFFPSAIRSLVSDGAGFDLMYYLVTPAFNVAGYFREIYLDFGSWGVALFSFVLGGLGAWLWQRVWPIKQVMGCFYVAVYIQIVALSFFYNHLLYLPSGFQFVLLWLFINILGIVKVGNKERTHEQYIPALPNASE